MALGQDEGLEDRVPEQAVQPDFQARQESDVSAIQVQVVRKLRHLNEGYLDRHLDKSVVERKCCCAESPRPLQCTRIGLTQRWKAHSHCKSQIAMPLAAEDDSWWPAADVERHPTKLSVFADVSTLPGNFAPEAELPSFATASCAE